MSAPDLNERQQLIAEAVRLGRYRYTVHGTQQRVARNITGNQVEEAIIHGEIIEDYPEHRYGPCCLVLGVTTDGRPLHVVCSVRRVVDIITVYDPDPDEWEPGFRSRRVRG